MREASIHVRLEPTNPGHFFACCGFFELADRAWNGAEGWFDCERRFCIGPIQARSSCDPATLLGQITDCQLSNAMTSSELERRSELAAMPKKQREEDPALKEEKDRLDSRYREASVLLAEPFNLTLNWFLDNYSGGKELKTWAGQQSVIDIARGMRRLIDRETPPEEWLFGSVREDAVPFNFDSDLGSVGSDLDLGFSIDPLRSSGLIARTRPMLEFAAFVGLQRFRPKRAGDGTYHFSMWSEPLSLEAAMGVACGSVECLAACSFEFRLLYRTKYLKSFLPARAVS
jgi:CRISPR-associated protein Csb3